MRQSSWNNVRAEEQHVKSEENQEGALMYNTVIWINSHKYCTGNNWDGKEWRMKGCGEAKQLHPLWSACISAEG